MDYNIAEYRQVLTRTEVFGDLLAQDVNFKLTSPQTFDYNCIAFAMGVDDRWIDCADIPWHWWPETVARDRSKSGLIAAFKYLGFEECGMDDRFELNFEKVALYARGAEWTHAARIVAPGIYHSKFGASFDGQHSSGEVLSAQYGQVYQIMRRPVTEAAEARKKMGVVTGVVHLQKKVKIGECEDHLVLHKGRIYLANHGREVLLRSDGNVEVV